MPIVKGQAAKVPIMVSDPLTGAGVVGIDADISGRIYLDGGVGAAPTQAFPAELDATHAPGVYVWDLTAAETDGDLVVVHSTVNAPASGIASPVFVQTQKETAADVSAAVWSESVRTLTASLDPDAATIAAAVWSETVRTLTASLDPDAATIAAAVWAETIRTLSEEGDTAIANATATAVWAATVRTLTASLDPTAADIWSHASRELTAGGDASIAAAVWAETIRTLTTEGNDAIVKDLLSSSVALVEDTASTHSLAELILMATESAISGTTMTIRKTDGTTFGTRTLTTDPAAQPVVGID